MSTTGKPPAPEIIVGTNFESEFPGASRLATECYANLVRTGNMLIGLHDRQAWEDYRLSGTAKQSLAIVEGAGEPLEPSVIAERLLITSGSMTSVLDTLERRKLIRRLPHPDDRRKLLVAITDDGAAIVDALLPSLHARERDVIAGALTTTEQRALRSLLAKVQASAIAHANDEPDRAARRKPERATASSRSRTAASRR